MRQDRRILGYLTIVVSLVCCLPAACFSGLMAFLSTFMLANPTYAWQSNDTVVSVGSWMILAVSILAGLALAGFGLWLIFSATQAPVE